MVDVRLMDGAHEAQQNVGGVCGGERGVEKKEEEKLEIALADAGSEPDAVVVEAEDASVTRATVVDAGGFRCGAWEAVARRGRGLGRVERVREIWAEVGPKRGGTRMCEVAAEEGEEG